jgi:two-component system chemotaxis sensor kinase CheA
VAWTRAVYQQLVAGLADLERNTRDLQEAVMSIRMIPMSVVFNRFPRMLRDLAAKLGKKVELVTQGEATELDKGLVEKITDPLTHLVRNSCDHGIECRPSASPRASPRRHHHAGGLAPGRQHRHRGARRRQGPEPREAAQQGPREGHRRPRRHDRLRGLGLIFAPGFSTAEQVTDVSGRGVGMDVVKKNITSLGGTVEIDSAEGYGMRVAVRLPLTLAIMDGMSVGVGDEATSCRCRRWSRASRSSRT